MVRHQAIGPDCHAGAPTGLGQKPPIEAVVLVAEERLLPAIAALRHMIGTRAPPPLRCVPYMKGYRRRSRPSIKEGVPEFLPNFSNFRISVAGSRTTAIADAIRSRYLVSELPPGLQD